MKTLYESILSSTKSGITGVISDKIKDLIEKLNAGTRTDTAYLQQQFFKDNDLLLDNKNIEKLLKNMAKNIKSTDDKAIIKPGIKAQIEKGVEIFADIENYNSISYGVAINVDFVWGSAKRKDYIIYISEACIFVLDNDETKTLLNKMDEYFSKYKTVSEFEYMFGNGKKITRPSFYADGKYRRYDYKDMKKFFEVL